MNKVEKGCEYRIQHSKELYQKNKGHDKSCEKGETNLLRSPSEDEQPVSHLQSLEHHLQRKSNESQVNDFDYKTKPQDIDQSVIYSADKYRMLIRNSDLSS